MGAAKKQETRKDTHGTKNNDNWKAETEKEGNYSTNRTKYKKQDTALERFRERSACCDVASPPRMQAISVSDRMIHPHLHGELVHSVTGEHGVRVTVDEAGDDAHPGAVDDLGKGGVVGVLGGNIIGLSYVLNEPSVVGEEKKTLFSSCFCP